MNIRRQAAAVEDYSNRKKSSSIKQLFDIKTLDLYCRYVVSDNSNIRLSGLALIKGIFDKVKEESYGNDIERVKRIQFIKKGLEARIDKHLKDRDIIIQYINGGIVEDNNLLDGIDFKEVSDEELAYINDQSATLSNSYFVDEYYDEIVKLSTELHSGNMVNREEVINKIKKINTDLYGAFNKAESAISTEPEFSLLSDDFEQTFRDIYSRETSPSRCLTTGLTGLNRMIDGGFYSGRVYLFFGTAATGKSFLALDVALQIAKYNRRTYKVQDPTKRPCIVFLTMENSVQENVARMFNMMTGHPMKETTDFEEANKLFSEALRDYSGGEINFFMEYQPYLSKSTNYLYQLVDKVKANGDEPICIIQDHIKRIRAAEQTKDMRQDLGNIVNEFKAFANTMDIPVISISHLNRDAAKNIGENKNRKDVIRTLGSNNVSDSLLMVDNCDVGIILNKETDSNNNLYMGFMQIKTRTKCDLEVFFQPFKEDCSLKMIEDVDEPIPAFRNTLMDKNISILRNYSGSDYRKNPNKSRDDDDLEMFSNDNMSEVVEEEQQPLVLNNMNQNKFIVTGQPSPPIFAMPQLDSFASPIPQYESVALTQWEMELENTMYNEGMIKPVLFEDETRPGFYIPYIVGPLPNYLNRDQNGVVGN